jgi:lipopolysaccharide export system protein LptC
MEITPMIKLFNAIIDGTAVFLEKVWKVLRRNVILTICFMFIMLGITFAYGHALTDQAEIIEKKNQKIDYLQDKITGLELDLDEAWRRETELRAEKKH